MAGFQELAVVWASAGNPGRVALKAFDILQRESVAATYPFSQGSSRAPAAAARHRPQLVINGRFLEQAVTGVQRVAREVTREIDGLIADGDFRVDVTLLHPPGATAGDLQLKAIRMQPVGTLNGSAWEQFALPSAVGDRRLLCLGNSAPLQCLLAGKRVGVMIHDLSYLDYPGAYRRSYRWSHRALLPLVLSRASKLFLVSETERERLVGMRADTAGRIVVAPNGGWVECPNPELPSVPAEPLPTGYGLFVGSLSHRKNFDRLLQAAIRLAREDGLPFVFVGSSGSVLTKPRIEIPAELQDRIVFVGQVNDRALLGSLYRDARLLVFPSLYEASPLPPFEAAHFGCPVVASNIPSLWERCDDGVAYCNPRSVDSIVEAVRAVLREDDERERRVEINRHRAAKASWREQAGAVLAAMIELPSG
jgi:glycosyltransferase involved in cell wall biosynthesis